MNFFDVIVYIHKQIENNSVKSVNIACKFQYDDKICRYVCICITLYIHTWKCTKSGVFYPLI